MADNNKKEEILIKAKALVYLKYDTECKAIGETLNVRQDDSKEMIEKGYIKEEKESLDELSNESGTPKGGE